MAIAFDSSASLGFSVGTSHTQAFTVGAGSDRILFVQIVANQNTDDITGVTYNGSALTLVDKQQVNSGGNGRWHYLFYLLNPSSGLNNVIISASTSTFIGAVAVSYTGVNQGTLDGSSKNVQDGTPITSLNINITVTASNCWIITAGRGEPAPVLSSGTLATLRQDWGTLNDSFGMFDSNGTVSSGADTVTINADSSCLSLGAICASIAPAVVSTTSVKKLTLLGIG